MAQSAKSSITRPNCHWLARFDVEVIILDKDEDDNIEGGRIEEYSVTFTVSEHQKNTWAKRPRPRSIVRCFCYIIQAKLKKEFDVETRVTGSMITCKGFDPRFPGSYEAKDFPIETKEDADAVVPPKKSGREPAWKKRIGEGQDQLAI